ncbi:response regulator [Streptomyces sp. NPDC060184]|uniref:response regulator n=1 Tax=Streptomyces sp. NPDC060184 TaxID=3347064 RepID=UPI00365172DB
MSVRILAADDHRLLREALCDMLRQEAGFTVVAQAGDGPSTVNEAARTRPDVILLDAEMPGCGPVATVRALRAQRPCSKIIVLTMHEPRGLVSDMLTAGAHAYLHKSVSRTVLVSTIHRQLHTGGTAPSAGSPRPAAAPEESPLTTREDEVMALVAQALSNRQIGKRLGITEGTVKRHLRNVFAKLGVNSRIEAVNALFGMHPGPAA